MSTVNAEDVRIPRAAREALARHEDVVVLNRERPVYVIVNPEDRGGGRGLPSHGRPLGEALALLAGAAAPDPEFAADMASVRAMVGGMPEDPWAPS